MSFPPCAPPSCDPSVSLFMSLDLPVCPIDGIGPLHSGGRVSKGEVAMAAVLDIEAEVSGMVSKVDVSEEVWAGKVVDV